MNVWLALVHAPVRNRAGEEIAASVNEYDWFDASRLALSYPVRRLFLVQPVAAQQAVARRLIAHGLAPDRDVEQQGVFDRAALVDSIEAAVAAVAAEAGRPPLVVATTARPTPGAWTHAALRARIAAGDPVLVLFGKAWGLAERVIEAADARLEPVEGGTGFNHLSVRSAMAIIVDRLLAPLPAPPLTSPARSAR